MAESAAVDENPILKGRGCGTCTLCCKVMEIPELQKPRGLWCAHCKVGSGCTVYSERPNVCRDFYCAYLTTPMFGEQWFPGRSKMVANWEYEGERLTIHVDPGRPTAWREQPYYAELKQWAAYAARDLRQVVVRVGDRSIVILPDEDVDLGHVTSEERIVLTEVRENGSLRLRALKLRADDPRLAGVGEGEIRGSA